jgi:hypothetical protein
LASLSIFFAYSDKRGANHVEHPHAWLHNFRRLRIRFEHRADIHDAFPKLDCCLICGTFFSELNSVYKTVSYYTFLLP